MVSAPRGLHGALVHDLGRKIVDGVRPAGSVVSHDQLCAEYDASRPTVREALRVLESKGLLRIRQSLGTRVQPIEEWNLLDADVVTWRLAGRDRDQQIRELLQMRLAVEPVAAGLAARSFDAGATARLEASLAALNEAADAEDVHAFTEADIAYHRELLTGCGNRMFPKLSALVASALEAREQSLSSHYGDLSRSALDQHAAVVAAVRAGESATAEEAMRAMLNALLAESPATNLAANVTA